jgi:hypothetical protein
LLTAVLLGGCSEPLSPNDDGCYGWYQGFYILSTPESLYVRVELDMSWGLPDSAWIYTPQDVFEPDRVFERDDPPGLAVAAAAFDIISGWYTFRARYDASVRVYEEHVIVRNDVLNYDFGSIEPQRGATGLSLTPLFSWTELRDTQSRVRVYADSLREDNLFDSGGIDDADSIGIPPDVLDPGTLYYWTLEIYDWQEFVPDCGLGYYYMDFFDNGLIYVGWFTTGETPLAGEMRNPVAAHCRRAPVPREYPPLKTEG